jgi:hypothetical protein
MATNTSDALWSVQIVSLPQSVTVAQLANTFNIPRSRIRIPETQQYATYYAFVDDFNTENDARAFADQWSGTPVLGNTIKCSALPRKNDDLQNLRVLTSRLTVETQPELPGEPLSSEEETDYQRRAVVRQLELPGEPLSAEFKGKYVIGLKKFVQRQMVEKFLSKNFRRHSSSSTRHLLDRSLHQ